VKLLGIDSSPHFVQSAQSRNEWGHSEKFTDIFSTSRPREFREMHWWDIPQIHIKFDLVIASEIIEHVHDPEEFLGTLAEVCTEWLVLTTPGYNPDDKEPSHLWTFTDDALLNILVEHWERLTFFEMKDPGEPRIKFRFFIGRKRL
jgi:hypothetical protein